MADHLAVHGTQKDLLRIEAWVDAFVQRWSLPASTAFALQLCCEEVFSNIVRHGLRTTASDTVGSEEIELFLDQGRQSVILRIDDQAEAFDPLEVAAPAHPQSVADAPVGGLGILLVRKFAQDVRYERRGQVNSLTMRFDLPNAGSSGPGSLAPSQSAREPAFS